MCLMPLYDGKSRCTGTTKHSVLTLQSHQNKTFRASRNVQAERTNEDAASAVHRAAAG